DCDNVFDAIQSGRGSGLQIRQDSPNGFAVLAQMQLLPNLRLARAPESQSGRPYRPINAAFRQKQFLVRLKEAALETAGTGVANEDFHFPKNQVKPIHPMTSFRPRFGLSIPAQDMCMYLTSPVS